MVSCDLLFSFVPSFYPLRHGLKSTSLNKIGNFSPSWINTIGDFLLNTTADSPVCLTIITNNFSCNLSTYKVVVFLLVPLHWQENFKRATVNEVRQEPTNFKDKIKHRIGCYPKYLLIFTSYQVQGWRKMIIIPVIYQPDGSNVTEILLKRSWHTHLKNSKPYIFILRKGRILHMDFVLIYYLP